MTGRVGQRTGRRPLARLVVGVALALVAATGCSSKAPVASNAVQPPAPPAEHVVFVALGGDETLPRGQDGLVSSWPQQVFSDDLPPAAVYVNLASEDARVAAGVSDQLPAALALDPTVATVWFGRQDARDAVTDAAFSRDLTAIVTQLQSHGAKVLLLGTTGDAAGSGALLTPVVQQVATDTGATFVAVPAVDIRSQDPAVQDAIAQAVGAALTG